MIAAFELRKPLGFADLVAELAVDLQGSLVEPPRLVDVTTGIMDLAHIAQGGRLTPAVAQLAVKRHGAF